MNVLSNRLLNSVLIRRPIVRSTRRHIIGTSHASQRDDEVFASKLSNGIVVSLKQ